MYSFTPLTQLLYYPEVSQLFLSQTSPSVIETTSFIPVEKLLHSRKKSNLQVTLQSGDGKSMDGKGISYGILHQGNAQQERWEALHQSISRCCVQSFQFKRGARGAWIGWDGWMWVKQAGEKWIKAKRRDVMVPVGMESPSPTQ